MVSSPIWFLNYSNNLKLFCHNITFDVSLMWFLNYSNNLKLFCHNITFDVSLMWFLNLVVVPSWLGLGASRGGSGVVPDAGCQLADAAPHLQHRPNHLGVLLWYLE